MSRRQIRHDSPVHRFDDSVTSRAAGLALVLYGGISLGLIVALAASAHTAAAPSACTPPPVAVSSVGPLTADASGDSTDAQQRGVVTRDSMPGLGFGFLVFDWDSTTLDAISGFAPVAASGAALGRQARAQ
jgi:hypothetical protein